MRILRLLFLLQLILWFCSCAGHGTADAPGAVTVPAVTAHEPAGGWPGLPAPASLAERFAPGPEGKRPSYAAADLSRAGENFDPSLPYQHVSATASGGLFEPNWPKHDNPSFDGLAFALYPFQIKGYSGLPELHYFWNTPPAVTANFYYGLANWDADRWDWFVGEADGALTLPSLAPYMVFNGGMLVCVLKIGTGSNELDSLRFGSAIPDPHILATPSIGLAPLLVDFDASASSDPDGSIAEYRWDPEGDGSFDVSTGTDPHFSFSYDSPGQFLPAVQTLDNSGTYNEAQTPVQALSEVTFSYGSADFLEESMAVMPGSNGDVLLAGRATQSNPQASYSIFASFNPDATVNYYWLWGGSVFDCSYGAAKAPDGSVFACGQVEGLSGALNDGLLQKWSPDGQLLWSKAYGNPDARVFLYSVVIHGSDVYVCGDFSLSINNTSYAMLLKLDLDGNLIWRRDIIDAHSTSYHELAICEPQDISPPPSIKVCGYYTPDGVRQETLASTYNEAGDLLDCQHWSEGTLGGIPGGICVSEGAAPVTYIFGTVRYKNGPINYIGCPGGAMYDIGATDAFNLQAMALRTVDGGSLSGLFYYSTSNADINGFAELNLDGSLNILDSSLHATGNGSFTTGIDFCDLDTGHIAVCGNLRGSLPAPADLSFSLSASSSAWLPLSPPTASPVLEVHDTDLTLTPVANAAFNRGASDVDLFICVH